MSSGLATPLMLDLAATTMRDRHRDAKERTMRSVARRSRVRRTASTTRTQ